MGAGCCLRGPGVESRGVCQFLLKIFRKLLQTLFRNNNLSNFKTDYPSLGDFFFSPFICHFVVVLKRGFFVFVFVFCIFCLQGALHVFFSLNDGNTKWHYFTEEP